MRSSATCERNSNQRAEPAALESGTPQFIPGLPSMSFFITLLEMTDASRRDLEALPKVHSLVHHGLPLN